MKNKIVYMIMVIIAFASCKAGEVDEVSGRLSLDVLSGSNSSNLFEKDAVGFFVLSDEKIYGDCDCYINNKAICNKGNWQIEREVWLSQKVATIYGYYPFNSEVYDPRDIPITSSIQVAYQTSRPVQVDALSSVAKLQLSPILTSLKLKINRQDYNGPGHITDITLQGIGKTGTVNLIDNSLTTLTWGSESYNLDLALADDELIIKLIVFPQSLAESSVMLTIDKELYTYDLEQGSWEAGKEYTYTLAISQDENKLIGIGDSSIDNWEPGEEYEGTLNPSK